MADRAGRQGQDGSVAAEYIIRMLGLEMCADTPVGNTVIRGISGGQKKRVTSGEMLVSAKRVHSLHKTMAKTPSAGQAACVR